MTENINGTQPQGSPEPQPGQQIATPAPQSNDVPTWLPKRLDDERDAERRRVLKEFGVEKFDDLKALIDFGKQARQAAMTEAEKANAAIKDAQDKLVAAEAAKHAAENRAKELEQARVQDRVDNLITSAAQSAGANNSAHVLKLLRDEKADKVTALANDKGEVDAKAAETLVNEFKTANPTYFKGGGPGSPSNRGGKTPDPKAQMEQALKGKKLFNL